MSITPVSRRRLLSGSAALLGVAAAPSRAKPAAKIDRKALVTRHNPRLKTIDPAAPLMLGNGNIAFTADITGLQTFPEQYAPIAPLLIEAQWAWHSFPNPKGYTSADTLVPIDVRGARQLYPYMKSLADTDPAFKWIRENPHRFSLGRLSFDLRRKDDTAATFADISETEQMLDLWTGTLTSRFRFDGEPVEVVTRVHSGRDMIMADIASPLLADGRLAVIVKFPGVSANLNPDPSDWDHPEAHQTKELDRKSGWLSLSRKIDNTTYFSAIKTGAADTIVAAGSHAWRVSAKAGASNLTVMADFAPEPATALPETAAARQAASAQWVDYWRHGGVVDFAGSTDPRAHELERRVVLSQYLMAINAAGEFPPQEEGLFSNSWNGKAHLEMHPWHSAHFATWGRSQLLERSLNWYVAHIDQAKARATAHGLKGAWWPKMIGPDGVDSPSSVSPFIMWQQPHPVYMAELVYRAQKGAAAKARILDRYGRMVAETADLLSSFLHRDDATGRYVLGPPVIPVQENWDPFTTFNPAFELAYFQWGIETAQAWRVRLGQPRRADWDERIAQLSPLPQKDGLYLPTGSNDAFWTDAGGLCSRNATKAPCQNKDHPSVLMPLGWLPGRSVDRATMKRTLDVVAKSWDLRQTWGWDYPMIAMTATRLGEPEQAIDWLFYDGKNNKYGSSGMTPRVHLNEHADAFVPVVSGGVVIKTPEAPGPDGPGFRRAAETYFPSNGGLLAVVALMAAGWDGETRRAPGFPKDGWTVRFEDILPSI
jgi:hypothetical protein